MTKQKEIQILKKCLKMAEANNDFELVDYYTKQIKLKQTAIFLKNNFI